MLSKLNGLVVNTGSGAMFLTTCLDLIDSCGVDNGPMGVECKETERQKNEHLLINFK